MNSQSQVNKIFENPQAAFNTKPIAQSQLRRSCTTIDSLGTILARQPIRRLSGLKPENAQNSPMKRRVTLRKNFFAQLCARDTLCEDESECSRDNVSNSLVIGLKCSDEVESENASSKCDACSPISRLNNKFWPDDYSDSERVIVRELCTKTVKNVLSEQSPNRTGMRLQNMKPISCKLCNGSHNLREDAICNALSCIYARTSRLKHIKV